LWLLKFVAVSRLNEKCRIIVHCHRKKCITMSHIANEY
jgi:hypothetical protein